MAVDDQNGQAPTRTPSPPPSPTQTLQSQQSTRADEALQPPPPRRRTSSISSSTPTHDPRHRNFHPLHRQPAAVISDQTPPLPAPTVDHPERPLHTAPTTSSPFITPVSSRPSTPRRNNSARLLNPRNYSPRSRPATIKAVAPSPLQANHKLTPPLRVIAEQRHSRHSLRSWISLKSPSSSLQAELGSVEVGERKRRETAHVPARILTRQKPRAYSLGGGAAAGRAVLQEMRGSMPAPAANTELALPAGVVDMESGFRANRLRSNSKVSLPMRRDDEQQQQQRQSAAASESPIEWGPLHPCYPHLNPHVPVASPLYTTTRVIRVPRDWMPAGDLSPAFANVYPEVLEGILEEQQFRELLAHVNKELSAIFDPFSIRNWADSFIGLVTFWFWDDLGLTAVKKRLAALERWIEQWNRNVGLEDGVQIIPLRRTAYMSLDIQIPDPQISPDPVARSHLHPDDGAGYPQSPYGLDNVPARVAAAA